MDKKEELQKLEEKMAADNSLPLKTSDTNLVFGVGDPNTNILAIGEGPGYWENLKEEPFVGNAGKFLDQLLQTANLERQKIYITNVVHHRPPENRDPFPNEIEAYGKYLDEIIRIIEPEIILTLGRFSMGKFLPDARISSVHGKIHRVNWNGKEIIVIPMYHPAASLRNGEIMRLEKEDFLKLPDILNEVNQQKSEDKIEQMNLI